MKKRWFRARSYGWGWFPASWEGWTVLAVWLFLFALTVAMIRPTESPVLFLVKIIALTAILFVVCWKTGERPTWRWAGKPISAARGIAYVVAIIAVAFCSAALAAYIASR